MRYFIIPIENGKKFDLESLQYPNYKNKVNREKNDLMVWSLMHKIIDFRS